MPYIPVHRRNYLDGPTTLYMSGYDCANAGELNFCITSLILGFVYRYGVKYETLNAVDGVLSQVGREFERRVVIPYEEKKIEENGDLIWPES